MSGSIRKWCWVLLFLQSIFSFGQFLDTNGNLILDGRKYLKSKVDTTGRKTGWVINGTNSLQINQNTFSNWMPGGENSVSAAAKIDYELSYRKQKHLWDNRILLEYGFIDNKTNGTRKTADNINITSSYGYLFKDDWYLIASVNLRSQFTEGYDYNATPKKKLSNFMAPGYLTVGVGANYIPKPNFQISIHPITSRTTFVLDKTLQKKDNFGLKEEGDVAYFEMGAYVGARYKFKLFENVHYDNNIALFSNYSDKPLNIDVVYTGNLDMKINNFLSTQLSVNLIYDEDQIKKTQLKQALGVGLVYKFTNQVPKEKRKKKRADRVVLPIEIEPKNLQFRRSYYNRSRYDSVFIQRRVSEHNIKSETIFN
ncbi:DUF3078 domain-containing protein [uncultured Weeksella sp.]|uniref:DUF3078 domain-containing protein n=1 Tax=uncultured Weeksella sp. TaxID=1161389 RepID=UPI00259B49D6|nr:DUF3078 domain-containing protein [uncultured Weeksella sp.]